MNLQFFQNLPNPPDDPADDVNGMQTNSASAFSWPTVDHFGYKTNLGGYHNVIHQPTGSGTQNLSRSGASASYTNDPAPIVNTNQVVAGQYKPQTTGGVFDTQLFNITGSGIISQLTGSLLTNTATSDGWAWVGGILIQWGFIAQSAQDANGITLTFKDRIPGAIPFPNNCFMVLGILSVKSGTTAAQTRASVFTVDVNGINSSHFIYNAHFDTPGIAAGIYWLAIGN